MTTDDDQPQRAGPHERGRAYGTAPAFRPAKREPLLVRTIPVAGEVPRYRLGSARRDLLAGLTVTALALPSAMAYGELAGLSPVNGLYALLGPTLAYVLLGSSRRLVIGPEGSVSTLVAAAVLPLAVAGSEDAVELASMLALLVAGCFLLARALRLGWVADYLSRPVLIGYLHGVAAVLVISQLGKLLGIPIEATEPLQRLAEVARELGDVSGATVALSVVALTALLLLRRFLPFLPGALLVVVTAIAASWALDFADHGIATVGPVSGGLPRPTLPTPPLTDVLELLPAAFGVFLVSFADEILTARAFAGRRGEHVRASQELLVMGAANAAAGFTQAFSVGASGARTAVNEAMGARTQIAGLFAAGHGRRHPALPHRACAVLADRGAGGGAHLCGDQHRRPDGLADAGRASTGSRSRSPPSPPAAWSSSACWRRSSSRSGYRSSTPCAAAPAPTTRCSAGCRGSRATATSPCTPPQR